MAQSMGSVDFGAVNTKLPWGHGTPQGGEGLWILPSSGIPKLELQNSGIPGWNCKTGFIKLRNCRLESQNWNCKAGFIKLGNSKAGILKPGGSSVTAGLFEGKNGNWHHQERGSSGESELGVVKLAFSLQFMH